jgi:hypothetical protein
MMSPLHKVPVYMTSSDAKIKTEIGQAVILEDGRVGIRFHQTEAGNQFLEMVQDPSMRGLYISYEAAQEENGGT